MKSIIVRNSNGDIILKIKKTKSGVYDMEKLKHVDELYITIVGHDKKRNSYAL